MKLSETIIFRPESPPQRDLERCKSDAAAVNRSRSQSPLPLFVIRMNFFFFFPLEIGVSRA